MVGAVAGFSSSLCYFTAALTCTAPLPSCRSPEEFSKHIEHALAHEPHPMSPEERRNLTWEAATERFLDVTGGPGRGDTARAWWFRRLPACGVPEQGCWE